jgi:hypothetical protein
MFTRDFCCDSSKIKRTIPPKTKQCAPRSTRAQEKRQRSIKDGLPLLRVARELIKELNICAKDKLSSFSLPYELRFRHVSSDMFGTFIAHLLWPMPLRQRACSWRGQWLSDPGVDRLFRAGLDTCRNLWHSWIGRIFLSRAWDQCPFLKFVMYSKWRWSTGI